MDNEMNNGMDNEMNNGMNNGYEEVEKVEGEIVGEENGGRNIFAVLALIFGILSIVTCCFKLSQLILGAAALVLGILSLKKESRQYKTMAIIGIVCGGLGIVFGIFGLIGRAFFAAILGTAGESLDIDPGMMDDILNSL